MKSTPSMFFRVVGLAAMSTLLVLGGCSEDKQAPAREKAAQPLTQAPALRGRLPERTVAYVRVPSVWGLFSGPKGDVLNEAMADPDHVAALRQLRDSLHEQVLRDPAGRGNPLAPLLLFHLRSPLEVAVLRPEQGQAPFPTVVATAILDVDSVQGVKTLIAQVTEHLPMLVVAKPLNDAGYGQLISGPATIHVHYDTEQRLLTLVAGFRLDEGGYRKTLEALKPVDSHRMYADEAAIDASRRGLFAWVDAAQLIDWAEQMMPPRRFQALQQSGATALDTAAAGWGVRGGKGRLQVRATLKDKHPGRHVTAVLGNGRLRAAGEPRGILALSLPSAEELARWEQWMRGQMGEAGFAEYRASKAALADYLGVYLEDLLASLGPDLVVFADRTGSYLALQVRDAEQWTETLRAFASKSDRAYHTHQHEGRRYHHLVLPEPVEPAKMKQGLGLALAGLLFNHKTHLHWVEQDGYLIAAAVPQALRDRLQFNGTRTSLRAWLADRQHQDPGHAVFVVSTTLEHSPQRLYYSYLKMVRHLADAAGYELDLLALPSASELQLPSRGTYGLQLDVHDNVLALELTFERNPVEFLVTQRLATLAVAGILASIAIPAYQDYALRARVSQAWAAASARQMTLTEFHRRQGRFPNDSELAELNLPDRGIDSRIQVEPNTGRITVTFVTPPGLAGRRLMLIPQVRDSRVQWRCISSVPARLAPPRCR